MAPTGATRVPVRFHGGDSAIIANYRALIAADGSLLEMPAGLMATHRAPSLDMLVLVKGFVDAFAPRAAALAAAVSPVAITVPTAQLDKLVGEYSLNAAAAFRVTPEGGDRVLSVPGGGRLALLAPSQTQLFVRKPDLVFVFDVDVGGVAKAVTLIQGEGRQCV